jgi:hypothetical protein
MSGKRNEATGRTAAQGPSSATAPALNTPWGEPDLQGIWTDEFDTPLQRPARYANQEFFTEAQRAELDKERSALLGRRATERELAGAYNLAVFTTAKHTGPRTSRVVDPPDGRIPPLTVEAQKAAAADREYRLALLQTTDTCKTKLVQCRGGTYDPVPSLRRAERPPRYLASNFGRINRYDGPEDGSLSDRCLHQGLPEFGSAFGGSFRRIVQTPGGISIFYDVGQGEAWQRNIVMNGSPHLPPSIRQWYGDSRGHWRANARHRCDELARPTIKARARTCASSERWTRTGPNTLAYEVTSRTRRCGLRPWRSNRVHQGRATKQNHLIRTRALPKETTPCHPMLLAARKADLAFAERVA